MICCLARETCLDCSQASSPWQVHEWAFLHWAKIFKFLPFDAGCAILVNLTQMIFLRGGKDYWRWLDSGMLEGGGGVTLLKASIDAPERAPRWADVAPTMMKPQRGNGQSIA
jgi:hypothetical protein